MNNTKPNDWIIESKNSNGFWDVSFQRFDIVEVADVYPTEEDAEEECLNTEGEGFVRQLEDDEQKMFIENEKEMFGDDTFYSLN